MTRADSPARARGGRAAPQSDARSLLASGRWVSAAEYADLLGDGIPDERAAACWRRLNRAGHEWTADDAERVRLGRERLAQEALQRLVQRGEMEAVGTGSQRQYRFTSREVSTVFAPRPKPVRKSVPLERCQFPLALQMRELFDAGGEQVLFSEEWVQRLLELRRADPPAQFEPLEGVEEQRKGKEPVVWIFRGFHRGEMWRRAGAASVEVLIYPGTFADAQFYALAENSAQPLPRTPADCRRAFDTMIDTPALLRRVMEAGEKVGGGGVHRAMAAACGISNGAVDKYLRERGVTVDRKTRKLVAAEAPKGPPPPPATVKAKPDSAPPRPDPAPKPEPASPARASEPDPEPVPELEPATPAAQPTPAPTVEVESDSRTALVALAEASKLCRAIDRQLKDYLLKATNGARDRLLAAAQKAGVPFLVTEAEKETYPLGRSVPEVLTRRVTTWPALEGMQAAFAAVTAQFHDGAARAAADEVSR